MAINAYDYRESVYFNPEKPSVYYGYYVSTSSTSEQIAPFSIAENQKEFEAQIRNLSGCYDWRLSALAALYYYGNDDQCDFAADLIGELSNRDLYPGETFPSSSFLDEHEDQLKHLVG